MRCPLPILASVLLVCAFGCGPAEEDAPDVGPAEPWAGYDVPPPAPLEVDCNHCHKDLTLPNPSYSGARAWLAAKGLGMRRLDPIFPAPGTRFILDWPERGGHDLAADQKCSTCHPVRNEDGLGHGLRTYPKPGEVFAKEVDCAASCHTWLPAEASITQPFGVGAGWQGSLRPAALLKGASGGHGTIWRKGLRPEDQKAFMVPAFGPGCGGCHNLASEDHGSIVGCMDCHVLSAGKVDQHALHVGLITTWQAAMDPKGYAAKTKACDYCHVNVNGRTELSAAACYNCHLSGHQPLNADGKAHFWGPGP